MAFTFATSQAIVNKAGLNVASAAVSGAILEQYSQEAEAQINAVAGID